MNQGRKAVVWIALAVGACVFVYSAMPRRGGAQAARSNQESSERQALSSKLGHLATVTLAELREPADVARFVDRCEFASADPSVTDADVAEVRSHAAAWLYHRFALTPTQYVKWRLESGYSWVPAQEMRSLWDVDHDWSLLFKDDALPAPDTPAYVLFERLLYAMAEWEGGYNKLVGVSTAPGACAIQFSVVQAGSLGKRTKIDGKLGSAVWYGTTSASTFRNWFSGAPDRRVTARPVRVCEVGFICDFQSGDKRPMILTMAYDESGKRWRIAFLCAYNAESRRLSKLEY